MPDLLTEEECRELIEQACKRGGSRFAPDTQWLMRAAARLGAERERERCARLADDLRATAEECLSDTAITIVYRDSVGDAIRRGEGE